MNRVYSHFGICKLPSVGGVPYPKKGLHLLIERNNIMMESKENHA
jgi:hypothetical protein